MHNVLSPKLLRGAVVASVCAALTFTGGSAGAAPAQKLGPVKSLAMTIDKPSSYRVTSDWDALANATAYKVTLTNTSAGTVLASQKITAHHWVTAPTVKAGDRLTLKVVPLNGKKPGTATSIARDVPDLTAPTGAFTVSLPAKSRTATVTQTALHDDLTTEANIKREINWDQGAGFEAWTAGTSVDHPYPEGKHAYHPSVRLTDEAGNTVVLDLPGVAIDDTEKPKGTFLVAPTRAWAKFTGVTVTQVGTLSDDVSTPAFIKRTVDWKDGTAATQWKTGMALRHLYTTAGTFAPTVTLTDEAGSTMTATLSNVVVKADTVKPRANLIKPRLRRPAIRSWVTLHGRANDVSGSGVRNARVRVVELRRGVWFGYRATTRSWVKGGTKAAALRKSRPAVVRPVAGKWGYRLPGLRKGTLVVKVWGVDNVGNVSTPLVYKQLLTRR